MFKYLNQKYPKYLPDHKSWKNGLFIAAMILMIFILFQPFGFRDKELWLKLTLFPLYSFLGFLYAIINFLLVRNILKSEKVWTIKNELSLFFVGLLPFTLIIHLFTCYVADDMPFSPYWYFKLFYHTASLFLLSVVIEIFYYNNKAIKETNKQLAIDFHLASEKLNNIKSIDSKEVVSLNLEKSSMNFNRSKIIFIQSVGNYLEFFLRSENNQFQKIIKRGRIHQIEKDLGNCPEFLRCHRAFIVNLKQVAKLSGNTKNAKLIFDNIKDEIPVSRLKFKLLKEQIEQLAST